MTPSDRSDARTRREPPPFRTAEVGAVEPLTPRMVRVVLAGRELEGLTVDLPAASVRLLIPSPGTDALVIPEWNGNEFLLPDGERPIIRTFTPRRVDSGAGRVELHIVVHDGGAVSAWAATAEPGARAAISGPGRGYEIEGDAAAYLLAGDETAIPAVCQLLEVIPSGTPVQVLLEVAEPEGRFPLPGHPNATVQWCDLPAGAAPGDALVAAVSGAELPEAVRVWAAGEAAAVQRMRRHLFEERAFPGLR